MSGILANGTRWALEGDVRVIVYAGGRDGTVQMRRKDGWGLPRPGEVTFAAVVELTLEASRADVLWSGLPDA